MSSSLNGEQERERERKRKIEREKEREKREGEKRHEIRPISEPSLKVGRSHPRTFRSFTTIRVLILKKIFPTYFLRSSGFTLT